MLALLLVVAVPQCRKSQNDCQKRGGRVVTDLNRVDWVRTRSPIYKAPTKCQMPDAEVGELSPGMAALTRDVFRAERKP